MRTEGLVEEIKSRVDIVDIVSSYVQLRKAGANWKGLCPFHAEKTPSFMVSPAKQLFRCFGCGAGGDAIAFVSKYENLTFPEALKLLAQKAGVKLPETRTDGRVFEKQERLRRALDEAAAFYEAKLRESAAARDFIAHRGLTPESVERFRIGYAPQGWSALLTHLRKAGHTDADIQAAGLAVAGTKGLYDMFRHRVMFPITAPAGTVIAFGGRALDDATAKYINSPETAVFRKSETLFGLHTAKEAIRSDGTVMIVEGYMDVVICHQFGIRSAVAPLGTSLTAGQLRKLRTMAASALLVFDGDAAGRAAARRAIALVCQHGFRARVLMLPAGEDPDSYLRAKGADAFDGLTRESLTLMDFFFRTSSGERADIVREALGLVAGIEDALLADEMLTELISRSGMHEETVRQEFQRLKRLARTPGVSQPPPRRPAQPARAEEQLLLSAVIAAPQLLETVLGRIEASDFLDPVVSAIFRRLAAADPGGAIDAVLVGADEDERLLVTRLSVEPGFDLEHVERNVEDCLRKIAMRKIEEQRRQAQQSGDYARVIALDRERQQCLKDAGV